ncbi:hypothetical protein MMC22_012041 [Lobaria immixta]|nr:hypothetical protein [Lobaria immixta]
MAEFSDAPPTDIDPYQVLDIETTATLSEVKSAYKKLALRHHPDKAHPDARDTAHIQFQEIACAYAILSDERRRKRYDTTGNTAESLDIDDDAFNWIDFFRAQWAEAVTGERLDNFKSTYQNSDEEKRDVLAAYRSSKGKLNSIFNAVMLSNPLDDEDRFRGYIDQAITDGDVQAYDAYVQEPKSAREKRVKRARKESEGAKEHAKTLGVYDSLFGGGKAGKARKASKKDKADAAEPDLAALLQQRANGRAATFLENLEAKYAGGKNGERQKAMDEPSEEAFQKTAARMKKRKARVIEEDEDGEQDDGEEIDLEQDSPAEEPVAPTKRRKSKRSKRSKRSKP